MDYVNFKREDVAGISKFLKENGQYLLRELASPENIGFIFEVKEPLTEEEEENLEIAKAIKQKVIESETEVAMQQVEVTHLEEGIKHNDKGANPSSLADAKAYLNSLKRRLEITKKIREQVLSGQFRPKTDK